MMNREKVGRRLDLVSSSAGSIISLAAWCALQASSADVIFAAIDERMRNASTSKETRCALLNVIHELLLTCAANGVPEAGKRSVLMAVSKTLPGMVQAVRGLAGADAEVFEQNLSKVVSWWSMLNIFPRAWIAQLGVKKEAEQPRDATGGASMPVQLSYIANLMSRYNEMKEEFLRVSHASPERAASLREEAIQQLTKIREVVHCKLDGGVSLVAWLDAERNALEGNLPSMTSSVVGQKEEDDVLGSFF
ncbi:hypothetical protein TCDM_08173 [Trypanosoma cruzi Dm28c]|uniref:CID domain-containing protein n=2 Tax=Trypanosoma cruzi TaxID=5693 RepID=V5D8U2_TRYCR|nr:hypothetical protein TCDM_08173 [Trypanosoma cruzi Dm28c]KAF8288034.1 hypothetical protein TcBrA4_0012590 [Trypanosoma cruzi]PBJ75278.1 hypothetical protein BCY84_11379 [Trypanosoma cruzi cruzi]PWU89149.1 hypothetical protein C4B63_63g80 [Trypanosoma cruzi]